MTRIGGWAFLEIPDLGISVEISEETVTYATGGPKREAILGSRGVSGYSEKPTVPYIEGTFIDLSDTDFNMLKDIKNHTVTLTKGNGMLITLNNSWYAGDYEGDSDGKRKFRFEGKTCVEATAPGAR